MQRQTRALICKIPLSLYGAEVKYHGRTQRMGFFQLNPFFLEISKNKMNLGKSSNANTNNGVCTVIQKLRILGSTKHFFWQVCHDILPTQMNLFKRKILNLPKCLICSQDDEAISHALWKCPAASDVQKEDNSSLKKVGSIVSRHSELWTNIMDILLLKHKELCILIFRNI